ncbi:oxidation resistance protein 1 isoform X3 [Culicoides brevitarsis]|uniref:oxidation resistance protein 1 isoform X3 n=1 Tax=Culicoides brevitarsis TaxID=469753 RepID=UPI00307C331C
MTSVLSPPGKYRSRKDWSTNSIPQAVEEEVMSSPKIIINGSPFMPQSDAMPPIKPPRRSSLAMNLLTGKNANGSDKSNKRRSSIAVAFLGRKEPNSRKSSLASTTSTTSSSLDTNKYVSSRSTSESDIENDPGCVLTVPDGYDKEKKRRRSSWQAKLERRRRKQGFLQTGDAAMSNETLDVDMLPENGVYNRQKRHSWWTIFVPDNLKSRSRRSSTEIGAMTRSADHLPYRRSKSRSVDHGLATPFDLDSLRSKVEERFERTNREEKKKSTTPVPTITYTVGDRDTLTSVAARFDTTPSELTQLNRLGSSFIYPGQTLQVPDKSKKIDSDDATSEASSEHLPHATDELPIDEKELLEGLRPTSPRPGHIERVISPAGAPSAAGTTEDGNDEDQVLVQRFLKINVRHITDGQGVVGGVLLVTPNAVMFDPNVSDPLVIEHGPESYGVIAPMEFIVNSAIFNDIAHMRVAGGSERKTDEKPEIYYPKSTRYDTHSPGKDSLVKDETFPELGVGSVDVGDDQESICSSNERDGAAFPKAFDRDLVTPSELKCDSVDGNASQAANKSEDEAKTTSNTLNTEGPAQKTLEERRRSLLDQHWAIPSKDRRKSSCDSNSKRSSEDEDETDGASIKQQANTEGATRTITSISGVSIEAPSDFNDDAMSKVSCHDSGIDIRDPVPIVQPIPTKKVYSDADIVLSKDWVPPVTIVPTQVSDTRSLSASSHQNLIQSQNLEGAGRKKTSSVSFSIDDNSESANNTTTSDKSSEKKNKMLKRLSYPLAWVEGLTGENKSQENSESAPNTGDSNQSVFSKVFSRRSSIGTFMRTSQSSQSEDRSLKQKNPPQPKLDYRSMVSIDDMPALFVSFDKLIPRPARACPDPPMYLRLRMGRQTGKSQPLPTTVMSYGKNKLRPEYWFSVPKNKVDELYRFFASWVPHLYGELDEEAIKARGFELIQHDTEWTAKGSPTKDGGSNDPEIKELTRESWEVLSMNDDLRRAALFNPGSFDQDFPIPDLIGQTEILSEEHREKLCGHLPARAEGYAWSLVFSTSQHGFSLNSLYRKMHKLESPVLIVIQDTEQNVFGALTSCSLHVSDHFYGTGESLLYKFNPTFKVFHWSGENLYFIKGNPESLAIGAGDGKFGLWLDGDLNQGRSQHCSTYANEPLAPQEDFVIKTLECWAFV